MRRIWEEFGELVIWAMSSRYHLGLFLILAFTTEVILLSVILLVGR